MHSTTRDLKTDASYKGGGPGGFDALDWLVLNFNTLPGDSRISFRTTNPNKKTPKCESPKDCCKSSADEAEDEE